MRLGFAVKVLGGGGLPTQDARRHNGPTPPHLRHSLEMLAAVLEHLDRHDIRMYRMSAGIAPYATHPDLPQFHGQVEECAVELAAFGERARELDIRLSTHPGQYIVLNSEDERVVESAIRDLEVQAELLDAMGAGDEAVVVLHVGGAAGGHEAGLGRFERGFERLSERARARLVIENDDRTYALADVLSLHERTGLRVVWDILHHHCNDPDAIPDGEALRLALATWPEGQTPKIHYSTPKTALEEKTRKVGRRVERSWVLPQLRAHADMIDPIGFEHFVRETAAGARSEKPAVPGDAPVSGEPGLFRDFDVMLEAKAKDLALVRLREQLESRGVALTPGGGSGRERPELAARDAAGRHAKLGRQAPQLGGRAHGG